MTARASVPLPLVYGGIAAIIALLVAVGFLAGRASTGGAAPSSVVAASTTLTADPAPVTHVAPATGGASAPDAVAITPNARAGPAGSIGGTPAAAPSGPPVPPALRPQVAEYFRRMDATQSAAKTWSDPNALAQEILAQAMKGDSSGFDKLVAASALARDGVRAITAPAPCAEHHRLSLALLEEAVVMLSKLRDGVAAGDPAALMAIASSGSALEERARAVDALAASLRAQYGVEPAPQ